MKPYRRATHVIIFLVYSARNLGPGYFNCLWCCCKAFFLACLVRNSKLIYENHTAKEKTWKKICEYFKWFLSVNGILSCFKAIKTQPISFSNSNKDFLKYVCGYRYAEVLEIPTSKYTKTKVNFHTQSTKSPHPPTKLYHFCTLICS